MTDFQPRFVFRDKADAETFDSFVLSHVLDMQSALGEVMLVRLLRGHNCTIKGEVHGVNVNSVDEAIAEVNVQIARYQDLHDSLTVEIERLASEEAKAERHGKD